MYARVIPIQCRPDLLTDFLSVYRSAVLPPLVREPGFHGALVLSDPEVHTGFIVTLWNSEAALAQSEMKSRKAVAAMLLPFLTAHPQPEQYEVLVRAGQHVGGLFARMITLPVPEAQLESARTVYEQEYLPVLRQQPGFQGVLWLANRAHGSGRGLSFWTSRDQIQAADRENEIFPRVLSRLAEYFSAPTERGYYAVSVQI